ncbi:retrovirus-related pol polyprotein from transposon TNT 1-94, partial [Tanacetum coccineum]
CQLDEQWFNLHKDILRDALDITSTNDDNPFVAPPSSDTNLWGIIHRSNIDYAERIWEEFVQSIQTFLTDRKNLTTASRGKKKTAHLLIPNVRFTKLIIHHLKTTHDIHPRTGLALHYSHEENVLNTLRYVGKDGREIFGMPIPNTLLTNTIKRVPYYNGYLKHVAEYQRYLDEEHDKADDKTHKPTLSQPSKPTPTPTEPYQKDQGKKRKLVKETSDVPSPAKRSKAGVRVEEPAYNEEEADLQRALELSLKEQGERTQGPAYPVVLREHDSGRIQPLLDVQGKGKEKVIDEQAAYDLLTLRTPKKKSHADQFIFQRRTPMPTEASGHAESPSLYAELALTDSEIESDNEVPKINTGDQDEGQDRPDPESQPQSSHVENLKLPTKDQVILEEPASSSGTLSTLQNLEKDLSFNDQFFIEKPQEEESGKTNVEAEVQSMVLVPIHQDTSSVPPMTTPVIDLTKSQSDSPLPTSTATISIITKITTPLPPPPPQPQQSTADPILVKCIGELEQHMAGLIQNNLALEESQAVGEIVTDAVDWAMQAPLRARFRHLPTVDMKEILQQRMFEDNSYKAHDVHNDLYEALQKSLKLDYSNQRLADQEEARKKRRKRRASGSSQLLPPLPPPSTGTSGSAQQQGSNAPSSSKTAALASQSMAWTTSDTRYESDGVHLSDDEDSRNDHLPKADSQKDWWKPLLEEERPATPEPAWIISSSNVSDVENN